MGLPVDPDTHLIKMPAPQRIESMMNTAFPDLRGKQWTKAVPPVPHGLMADVDAALTQKIFDLWVANYYSARNPLRLSSLVILGVVARMFRCATRSSCWCI